MQMSFIIHGFGYFPSNFQTKCLPCHSWTWLFWLFSSYPESDFSSNEKWFYVDTRLLLYTCYLFYVWDPVGDGEPPLGSLLAPVRNLSGLCIALFIFYFLIFQWTSGCVYGICKSVLLFQWCGYRIQPFKRTVAYIVLLTLPLHLHILGRLSWIYSFVGK
jgi:hypothetical protein